LLDPRTQRVDRRARAGRPDSTLRRIDVALAAWNAGEGTVRKHGGEMPPIPETQAHVQLVLELYWALLQNNLQRGARQFTSSKRPARLERAPHRPDNDSIDHRFQQRRQRRDDAVGLARYAERASSNTL